MAFRIRGSYLVAFAIAAGIAGWMYNGEVVVGGKVDPENEAPPIAQREAERSAELFTVRYTTISPDKRQEMISLRGRTQADAVIPIRSETSGVVEERLVDKGDRVNEGDLVCIIDRGTREAQVAQAEALLEQAEAEYSSNERLRKKGFASKNRLAQLKAARDAARASLAQAKQEMSRTEVRANASGTVQTPIAEVGDVLSPGGTCVTLVDNDPMFFIGQVPEREITNIKTGMSANVTLVTGKSLTGKVTYIAPAADPQTRTFRVEVKLENADGSVLDGLTANGQIALQPTEAYLVNSSWLSLADSGEVGLRYLDDEDRVQFQKVEIDSPAKDGFWVIGPEPGMRVVTLGHEFVGNGEKVIAVKDTRTENDKTAMVGGENQ